MSANKYKPHLYVVPEDDANRQIANGFYLSEHVDPHAMAVSTPAGGWLKVIDDFKTVYIKYLKKYQNGILLLLIDFDGKVNERLESVKSEIPTELGNRVFILGTKSEPEALKRHLENLKTYEKIGGALAQDCANDSDNVWEHQLLKHNEAELNRLRPAVAFLFPDKKSW